MNISRLLWVVVLPMTLTALIPLLRFVTSHPNLVFVLAVTSNLIPICFAVWAMLRRDWRTAAVYTFRFLWSFF